MKTIVVDSLHQHVRLDMYVLTVLDQTRSSIKMLIDDGKILVNNQIVKAGKSLKVGDEITIEEVPPVVSEILPLDIPFDILYQDSDIVVINKPQGLTVHPSGKLNSHTLVNALMFHIDNLSSINGVIRPGIVHRLDKETSGVMVVAKSNLAHVNLGAMIANRNFGKKYIALLEGKVANDSGNIATNIARDPKDRKKMAVTIVGKNAVSTYTVIARYNHFTLVEFDILTGRTHQIRVHAKFIGHPVVGDKTYGYKKQKWKLNGQLLHAKTLNFNHPTTNQPVTFTAPLPDYFQKIIKELEVDNEI